MCARVADRVTWYSVLGKTVCDATKCDVVCVCCGVMECVIWWSEWLCTSCVSTVRQFL